MALPDAEILDRLTLLLAKAREAKNNTARAMDNDDLLFGFVLEHHDYMAMHCLLNLERHAYDLSKQQAVHEGGIQNTPHTEPQ